MPNMTQLSALSRLFSSGVFREIATKGQSGLFARLIIQSGLSFSSGKTVGEVFDEAFSLLRRSGMRDEYVYRAALTQNVFLGVHSLKTACLLTEFRAGTCKADLAILNGTASVYEIKSERDSLSRLENQIENYRKVFAKVFVIAADCHIPAILDKVPVDVGVLSLTRRNNISRVRDAIDRVDQVCSVTIFESLRTDEARDVLGSLGVEVPKVPNTQLRSVMRAAFSRLNSEAVHRSMVSVLKRTRSLVPLEEFVSQLPLSLRPAALSISIKSSDQQRLLDALNTPFSHAMEWV